MEAMKTRKSWALGAVLLIAVVLLALPAIVLAGRGSGTPARSDNAKAAPATASAEGVRLERRESFRRVGCSAQKGRHAEPGV
jgi:hypothetical protein